ncbi:MULTISPECIES: PorP/SprF family type IX secretion system membrane protein [Mesoflavibacter]|uniref:PorP/SprF family type IX secretion system membrane protein n=1 Tax=Mesoflavibacter TaxID=444051 RepID=UPI000D104694|nr:MULTISPECIES: type IX secretion system membrane protein PorP/SprF [Mesoflavibacter]
MKNTFLTILILITLGIFSTKVQAQQDAQYTQYMYNPISINPAYAGTRDVFSFLGLYRTQWVGLDGAPKTFTLSGHSPVGEKVGLGMNVTHDEIFITNETYIDIDFSYKINLSDEAKLALGIKAGGHLLTIDTNRLNQGAFNPGDADAEINIDNKFSPQFGIGAYYYTNKFYLGLSVPNMLETEHFDENSANNNSIATAKERVNVYLMAGRTFDLNADLKFKPATLFKVVDGSPLQVDLSANFLIKEKLTLGAAYRWSAALSGMIGYQLSDQLMLGFAYDRETTELRQYNDGSFEFFLRFELFKRNNRMISPRFF